MNQRSTLLTGATLGLLAVSLGAFGAHALKPYLIATNHQETFDLAVKYQFYHTFAILFIGSLIHRYPLMRKAAWPFLLGVILFCGSLYLYAITSYTWFAFVTPLGGFLFIVGWLIVIYALYKESPSQD